jgi:hypothetical protein
MLTLPVSLQAELPSGPLIAVAPEGIAALHAGSGGAGELQPSMHTNDAHA